MATLKKYDLTGKEIGQVEADEALVKAEANGQMIKEYIVALRANARQWSANTKTRGEVNHGTKKPHAQKGTGRARVGSIRTPLWKGGGTTFGPHTRDHSYRLPGKVQRGALRSALSLRALAGAMTVVNGFPLEAPSTKSFRAQLEELGIQGKVLVVDVKPSRELTLSARNLSDVEVQSVVQPAQLALLRRQD